MEDVVITRGVAFDRVKAALTEIFEDQFYVKPRELDGMVEKVLDSLGVEREE